MFRNNWRRALAATAALSLWISSARAQSPNLIAPELIQPEAAHYSQTVEAQLGLYERSYTASGTLFYPYTEILRPEADARFVRFDTAGKEVKAGEVLATFTISGNEEELQAARLKLTRAEESYAAGKEEHLKALEELSSLHPLGAYEQEMHRLQLRRAHLVFEQFCYEQEQLVAAAQEALAELEESSRQVELIAPCDGILSSVTYLREGEKVHAGDALLTLYRPENALIRIDNSALRFRYGMEVTVASGSRKNPTYYTGRVVASDNLLPAARRSGDAYIYVEELANTGKKKLSFLSVSAPSQRLENVLIIPRRAITLEGGKYYVECVSEGGLQKRFVNVGLQDPSTAWILQGLEAGDVVVTD